MPSLPECHSSRIRVSEYTHVHLAGLHSNSIHIHPVAHNLYGPGQNSTSSFPGIHVDIEVDGKEIQVPRFPFECLSLDISFATNIDGMLYSRISKATTKLYF